MGTVPTRLGSRVVWGVTAVCIAGLAACSSKSSTTETSSGATTTVAQSAGGGDCEETNLTGTIGGADFTASSAVAVSLEDGKAYTLYVSDFPVASDDISMFSNPEPPEGKALFMVFNTVFNAPDASAVEAVAVGDEVKYSSEFGIRTMTMTAQKGSEPFQSNQGAEGMMKVTGVGDTFCGSIEYKDDEKSLNGTFKAPVTKM